jgi:hypothetical protein
MTATARPAEGTRRRRMETGRAAAAGWPGWISPPSKAGQVAAVKVLARELTDDAAQRDILVNAAYPRPGRHRRLAPLVRRHVRGPVTRRGGRRQALARHAPYPDWQQAVAARAALQVGFYRPGRYASRVACPLLVLPPRGQQARRKRSDSGHTRWR